MNITSTKNLRLSFGTSTGGTVTITLPNPKDDLTTTEIEQVMDLMIAKDIILGKNGSLASKKDIKIIDTTTQDLYDPED